MWVLDFVESVYLPSRVRVSQTYAADLSATTRKWSEHLGRQAILGDFSESVVSGFLASYRQRWSPRSTNDKRQILLCLWQAAYDRDLVDRPPRPRLIRRLPEDHEPPEAWTVEEVARLIDHAFHLDGMVSNIPAAAWWPSLFLTVYWTSCRIGALLRTPTASYDAQGRTLAVRRQKTRTQIYPLPESCCRVIDVTAPRDRRLLWPMPWGRRWLHRLARRIVESAGLPCPREPRQMFHRLRRTNLSYCAAVDPAIAQRQAGHTDYRTTLEHYVDPRICRGLSAADVIPDPLADKPIYTSHNFRIFG